MSITGVSSLSVLESVLLQSPNSSTNSKTATVVAAPSTTTSSSVSGTTADTASGSSNSVVALTKDLTSLLNSLVSGNLSAAKSDIAKLQTDLKTQNANTTGQTESSSTAVTNNPLDTLAAELSKSLLNGSTEGALQDLASYLVNTGLGTGALVNTSA